MNYFRLTFILIVLLVSINVSSQETEQNESLVCTETKEKNGKFVTELTDEFKLKSKKIIDYVGCEVNRNDCRSSMNDSLLAAFEDDIKNNVENLQRKVEEVAAGSEVADVGADPTEIFDEKVIDEIKDGTAAENAKEAADDLLALRGKETVVTSTAGGKLLTDVVEKSAGAIGRRQLNTGQLIKDSIAETTKPLTNWTKNALANKTLVRGSLAAIGLGLGTAAGGFTVVGATAGIIATGGSLYAAEKFSRKVIRTRPCDKKCPDNNLTGCNSLYVKYGEVWEGDKRETECAALPIFTNLHFQFFEQDEEGQITDLAKNSDLCANIHSIHDAYEGKSLRHHEEISVRSCTPDKISMDLSGDLKDIFGSKMEYEGVYQRTSRVKTNIKFKPTTKRAIFPDTTKSALKTNVNWIKFDDFTEGAEPKFCVYYGKENCMQARVPRLSTPKALNINESYNSVYKPTRLEQVDRPMTRKECLAKNSCLNQYDKKFSRPYLKDKLTNEEKKPSLKDIYAQRVRDAESSLTIVRNQITLCCNQYLEKGTYSSYVQQHCQELGPIFKPKSNGASEASPLAPGSDADN